MRHGVAAHKHILAEHGGPDTFSSTLWAAFATRGAEQSIRRVLAVPGHPDLNHAAHHLDIRKAVLTRHIDDLEQTVGATLLDKTPDPDGISLTAAGVAFRAEAVPVLAMLAGTGNGAAVMTTKPQPQPCRTMTR
ncbi:LysR family transcriptional regulator [Saccharopolyspora hattusasensis]|uniref:LysR family transcriptional regulator n=1 Tax=Saccharopolyspora hattusasensis TaxID=1128679 RepID=UPI003D98666E